MKDYYSIVRLSPNPNTDDSLSVGLVVYSHGNRFFKTSGRKVRVGKQLYSGSPRNIDWYLETIQAKVLHPEKESRENIDQFLFEYISRYSNGVVRFDPPRQLNVPVEALEFNRLFQLFVDDHVVETKVVAKKPAKKYSRAEFRTRVQRTIITPLEGQVNTKVTFPIDRYEEVYFSLDLDCIGKNGAVYAAKSFDFENISASTHDRHIGHYFILASVLNDEIPAKGQRNQFFMVADEPSEIGSEVHKQWEAVKKMPLIEVVPLENAETIAETILNAGAKPLF